MLCQLTPLGFAAVIAVLVAFGVVVGQYLAHYAHSSTVERPQSADERAVGPAVGLLVMAALMVVLYALVLVFVVL